jgi:Protein of unknown function (DUF429)
MLSKPQLNGVLVGYDPGGNNSHGLAISKIEYGRCRNIQIRTLSDAEAVISDINKLNDVLAIGIDTLAAWSTGSSGWRPADLWLRKKYKPVQPSIVSPNGLYGSMGLNGMAVLKSIRESHVKMKVTETHPKVLYWALSGEKYNYLEGSESMDKFLSDQLHCQVKTSNDHEWDAVISVLAALRGLDGSWSHELYSEVIGGTGRLIFPAGQTNYWWPS